MPFTNRADAGRRLAQRLLHLRGGDNVVLGLPRGGVPVAFEVAAALEAPLDVIIVRKLGVPSQRELAMGAIGEGGVRTINNEVVHAARVTDAELANVTAREEVELDRRVHRFRGDRPRVALAGKTAIIIDDGIATGSTARAACQGARLQGAEQVILAVPVAPPGALAELGDVADDMVALETPFALIAIGQWYADFAQTPDETVVDLIEQAAARHGSQPG